MFCSFSSRDDRRKDDSKKWVSGEISRFARPIDIRSSLNYSLVISLIELRAKKSLNEDIFSFAENVATNAPLSNAILAVFFFSKRLIERQISFPSRFSQLCAHRAERSFPELWRSRSRTVGEPFTKAGRVLRRSIRSRTIGAASREFRRNRARASKMKKWLVGRAAVGIVASTSDNRVVVLDCLALFRDTDPRNL